MLLDVIEKRSLKRGGRGKKERGYARKKKKGIGVKPPPIGIQADLSLSRARG